MQLPEYAHQVQEQIRAAAALGDERTQQVAGSLAGAADAAVRLAVLSAVTAAADEITAALAEADLPGSPTVTVALDGDDVRVQVAVSTPADDTPRSDDGDASARVSLRLSEALKADVERAAAAENVSVNTWLARAAATALARGPGRRYGDVPPPFGGGSRRITGWVTG
jgi:HicB family